MVYSQLSLIEEWSYESESLLSQTRSKIKNRKMAYSTYSCLYLLLWKNLKIKLRHKKELIIEILVPLLFCGLLILLRYVSRQQYINVPTKFEQVEIKQFDSGELSDRYKYNYMTLSYSPQTPLTTKIATNAANQLKLKPMGFNTSDEMELFMMQTNMFFGIVFNIKMLNENILDFTIRVPSNFPNRTDDIEIGWDTKVFHRPKFSPQPLNNGDPNGGMFGYITHGIASVQYTISNEYIKATGNEKGKNLDSILPEIFMQRFPYPPYLLDPILQLLSMLMALIFIIMFSYLVSQTVKHVTSEKERQLTETMKIMGLKSIHHWASWFITTYALVLIISFIIVLILKLPLVNDTPVLPASSGIVLFLFLLCYGASIVTFSFLVSSLFDRAVHAGTMASLLFFVLYLPYSVIMGAAFVPGKSVTIMLCFLMNTAMGFAFSNTIQWEANMEGLQFSNLFRNAPGVVPVSVGVTMLMLLLDTILYMMLALYIEKVFPGKHGTKHKWNYFLKKQYWCTKQNSNTVTHYANGTTHIDPDRFEDDPANATKAVGIRIANLRKTFGHKVAVDGLSLEMYDDEITVLLGHNGAGKTTTISMITGFLSPTTGNIVVNGIDTSENMHEVRKSLGICPQHNILFDDLTVQEHIIFYSRLKGLKPNQLTQEIDKYLRVLQLENKRHALSSTLSGGMKRKLSLGVALCGGSKVVLCDEPSSGMDPEARRDLWNLLEREKKGRTILLTTHFMDEADVLGDRIAIMSGGKLTCSGTPFFLKKKFGTGYQLICNKTSECYPDRVTDLVTKHVPNATIKSNVGSELSYSLPESSVPSFEALLTDLEQSQSSLHVNGYGISMTTLEDVFMRTGSEIHSSEYKDNREPQRMVSIDIRQENDRIPRMQRYWYQWEAMFFKKIICMRRGWIIPVVQIAIPIIMLLLTLPDLSIFGNESLPKLDISLDNYGRTNTLLSSLGNANVTAALSSIFEHQTKQKLTRTGTDMSEAIIALDKKTITFNRKSDYIVADTIADNTLIAWFNHEIMHTVPTSLNLLQRAVAKAYLGPEYDVVVSIHPLPFSARSAEQSNKAGTINGFSMAMNLAFSVALTSSMFILFVVKERVSKAKLLQFTAGVPPITYWFSHFIADMIIILLVGVGIMIVCLIQQTQGFNTSQGAASLVFIFIMYGLASLPFTYLLSFLFEVPATGMSRCFIINLIAGMGFFLTIFILRLMGHDYVKTLNLLRGFFLLLPSYGLSDAIGNQGAYFLQQKTCQSAAEHLELNVASMLTLLGLPSCDGTLYQWNYPGLGAPITAMFLTGIFLLIGIFSTSIYFRRVQNIKNVCRPNFPPDSDDIDDDVRAEKYRIENMTTQEMREKTLVMRCLTKYYKKFLAVNNLSVAVEHGECFGLLGVNGAGKTSAFKMLTGDENISYGEVWIEGNNAQTEMSRIYEMIGYCPQFDALLLEMTGYEILKMFCLIHGIAKGTIRELVERLANDLAFEEYLYEKAEGYSGGNRRKLNTAISLLGDPHMLYLDEPTSGIDPASRRKLWDMICVLRNSGKGIILTSHSMEECEALCTRIAIMVNGEFKCLGSPQHLKNKFSKTISLTVKLMKFEIPKDTHFAPEDIAFEMKKLENKVVEFIVENFPGAVLRDSRLRLLMFEIPLNVMPYSKIFGLMETNRTHLKIEDYSITQATLEQIFIQFAHQQHTTDKQD